MIDETASLAELRLKVQDLTKSIGALNAKVASIDGAESGLRRKILEHDLKLATIEKGEVLAMTLASKPYSE